MEIIMLIKIYHIITIDITQIIDTFKYLVM